MSEFVFIDDSCCANCGSAFIHDSEETLHQKVTDFDLVLHILTESNSLAVSTQKVSVFAALKELFSFNSSKGSSETDEMDVPVCFPCSILVQELYRSFKLFQRVRDETSYVSRLTEKMQEILCAAQGDIKVDRAAFQQRKQHQTKTKSAAAVTAGHKQGKKGGSPHKAGVGEAIRIHIQDNLEPENIISTPTFSIAEMSEVASEISTSGNDKEMSERIQEDMIAAAFIASEGDPSANENDGSPSASGSEFQAGSSNNSKSGSKAKSSPILKKVLSPKSTAKSNIRKKNQPYKQVTTYSCQECEYTSKSQKSIKKHAFLHAKPKSSDRESRREFVKGRKGVKTKSPKGKTTRAQTQTKLKCQFCNFWATRFNLTIHERIHTGEKPFACNIEGCTFRARQSTNLTKHMTTHSDEKLFSCDYCDLKTKYAYTMKTHKKNLHPDQPQN